MLATGHVTQAKPQGTTFSGQDDKRRGTTKQKHNKYDRDDKGAKAGSPPFRKEIRSFGSGAKGYRRR
jgi:hypothetical protein